MHSPHLLRRLGPPAALLLTLWSVLAAQPALGNVQLKILSVDPYTNASSYHKTEVEPDTFAWGTTIVATFQVGRFQDGGSSNVGWASTLDSGLFWRHGYLPGTTVYADPPGPWDRDTDPSVGYDAAHGVWMISSLAMEGTTGAAILISRSTDARTWDNPIVVDQISGGQFYDKDWVACDNNATSPYYGHCYVAWDDFGSGGQLMVFRSVDGGLTWVQSQVPSAGVNGVLPVIQPNGNVVIPTDDSFRGTVESFVSRDGGATFKGPFTISGIQEHGAPGSFRFFNLPSADVDAEGQVYVAWVDCRFRSGCSSNDVVYSTSVDGRTWTPVVRVPIDPTSSTVDHYYPGLAVDPSTSGTGAHLAVVYYFFNNASCTTCQVNAGWVQSTDGGGTWSTAKQLAGPIALTSLPSTTSGYMLGDYLSTSFVHNQGLPVFIVAKASNCQLGVPNSCKEAAVAPSSPPIASGGVNSSAGDRVMTTVGVPQSLIATPTV